ncbi:hypothetical protein XFF7766_30040 [Xanthomonas citri pv. fuscans]|nr:hypothetical protein XFF7766_30040 [Xanthomonas citri pv. fuscans]
MGMNQNMSMVGLGHARPSQQPAHHVQGLNGEFVASVFRFDQAAVFWGTGSCGDWVAPWFEKVRILCVHLHLHLHLQRAVRQCATMHRCARQARQRRALRPARCAGARQG